MCCITNITHCVLNYTLCVKLHTICNVCKTTHCVWINKQCTKLHRGPLRVPYEKFPSLEKFYTHAVTGVTDKYQVWAFTILAMFFYKVSFEKHPNEGIYTLSSQHLYSIGLSNAAQRWLAKHVRAGGFTSEASKYQMINVLRCRRRLKSQRRCSVRQIAAQT